MQKLRLQVAVVLVLAASAAPAPADQRWAPRELRERVVGCWQLDVEQKLIITAFGKHSVSSRLEGTLRTSNVMANWRPTEAAFELTCRAAKNADYWCLVAPDGDGLRVRVRQIVKDTPTPIAELHASRCAK